VLKLLPVIVLAVAAAMLLLPYVRAPLYDFPPPRAFSGPGFLNPYAGLKGNWQRANLHAHGRAWGGLTNGAQPSAQVVRRYRAAGYSVAGVSNYHSIAAHHGIDTIPLYEHGYNLGKHHQIAIGAREVEWFDFPLWQSISNQQFVIDRVRGSAALVALAHPPSRNAYGPGDMQQLTGYHLLEIVNGPFLSVHAWDAALSSGRAVWGIGNDDTHDLDDMRRSMRAWTMIDAPSASTADVVAALRAGRSYAVLRTNEIATAIDTTLAAVEFENGTLVVTCDGEPSIITFIGQNGELRKTVKNVMRAEYTFQPGDTYIRTVIRAARTSMFLNPVVRHDPAVSVPAATIDTAATWTFRGSLTTAAVVVALFYRKRRPVAAGPARHTLAGAKRKTA
jgi:hypothetical protein